MYKLCLDATSITVVSLKIHCNFLKLPRNKMSQLSQGLFGKPVNQSLFSQFGDTSGAEIILNYSWYKK